MHDYCLCLLINSVVACFTVFYFKFKFFSLLKHWSSEEFDVVLLELVTIMESPNMAQLVTEANGVDEVKLTWI